MKTIAPFLPVLVLGLGALTPLTAAPLSAEAIPVEAQWVAHVDVSALRESQLGRFLVDEMLAKRLPKQEGIAIDPVAVARVLESVTVYGDEVALDPEAIPAKGVAVLTGTPDFGAMLNGLLAYLILEEQVTVVQEKPFQLVQLPDETFLALLDGRQAVLSKSRARLEVFLATGAGNHPNLRGDGRFEDFGADASGALVVALVGGLAQLADLAPQARVLRLSRGLTARLGEREGTLSLRVTLDSGTSENALTVQRILQGLIALTSLTKIDDQNLSSLLRSTLVRQRASMVDLELSFPTARLIEMISAQLPPIELHDDATGGEALPVEAVTRASGSENCCPANLGDGDPRTGWAVTTTSVKARFELETPVVLQTVDFDWVEGVGEAFGFVLSTSLDGERWERRIVWDGGGRAPASVALGTAEVRFLELDLKRPQVGPLGLRALRLNGQRPALRGARASSDLWSLPGNLFDNDPTTRFEGTKGEILVEGRLRHPAIVREVGILWDDGGNRELQVYLSTDGIEWERVLALAGEMPGGELQRFNSRDLDARFVRLRAPHAAAWGEPAEVRFYGERR
jgi:hypothetical protein